MPSFHQQSQQAHQPSSAELDFDALFKQFEDGTASVTTPGTTSLIPQHGGGQAVRLDSLKSPPSAEQGTATDRGDGGSDFIDFDLVNFGLDGVQQQEQQEMPDVRAMSRSQSVHDYGNELTPGADTWNMNEVSGDNASYQTHGSSNGQVDERGVSQGNDQQSMNMAGFEVFQATLLQQQVSPSRPFPVLIIQAYSHIPHNSLYRFTCSHPPFSPVPSNNKWPP
jgi:hypothetical protein